MSPSMITTSPSFDNFVEPEDDGNDGDDDTGGTKDDARPLF